MIVINGYKIEPNSNLRGADLTGADLRGARLEGTVGFKILN